jgi:hypothetical protein
MELRKDPITRSWVITGDDPVEKQRRRVLKRLPFLCGFARRHAGDLRHARARGWSARSVVHPTPLYHIEGEPGRRGDGIYDRMSSVGAHEVLVENPSTTAICGMPATMKSDSSCAWPPNASRSQARPAHQVRQPFQGLRSQCRAGIQPSHVADHGHYVRAAARALRTARGARIFRQQRALRVLRHPQPGGAAGLARD